MGSFFSSLSSSSSKRVVDYDYSPAVYDYDKFFGTSDESYATARDLHYQEALPSSWISSSSSSSSSTRMVDYDYSPALYHYDQVFGTSDESYATVNARDLRYQEALRSSRTSSSTAEINHQPQLQRNISTCVTINQEEAEIKTENENENDPSRGLCYCMICMEDKPSSDIFRGTTNCTHSYCTECTIRYVATKVEENIAMIKCPDVDCTRLIEPYTFQDLIPADVFERWDKALCESLILSSEKVYCPFEDCSGMLVVDDDDQGGNDAKVTQTECPSCHRLFCAQCKVTWHAGIGCEEFQSLGNTTKKKKSSDEEDAMLIRMAKRKQWRRCPRCKMYVEKRDGCMHIRCRCEFEFCYGCGSAWWSGYLGCRICSKRPQILRRIGSLRFGTF